MSRIIRRFSYAISPNGKLASSYDQALSLRDVALSMIEEANETALASRKVTRKAAFTVFQRSLEATKDLPFSMREHMAVKELSQFINLFKHNKDISLTFAHTDLLPTSHPRSTRNHTMTASALQGARARWYSDDARITDARAKAILASAFSAEEGSVERSYFLSVLSGLPQGTIPGETLAAVTADGNSSADKSRRAKLQRRDRYGRFAFQGGGMFAFVRRANGSIHALLGRPIGDAPDSTDGVQVELPDGRIVELPSSKAEYVKAIINPTKDGYSKDPSRVSTADPVLEEADLKFVDAPAGWNKVADNKWESPDWVVFKDENGDYNIQANVPKWIQILPKAKSWSEIFDNIDKYEADREKNSKENDKKRKADMDARIEQNKNKPNIDEEARLLTPEEAKNVRDSIKDPEQKAKWQEVVDRLEKDKKSSNGDGEKPNNPKTFEFKYPDGAYKVNAKEYDPQGRDGEDSPDFTDDPVELAQNFDERDLIQALGEAVVPEKSGDNATAYGTLAFSRGDEFVPADAIYHAIDEAGGDAQMELAKIYDKALGNNVNQDALEGSRKKESVGQKTPELDKAFKKVAELPANEGLTEPKFDAQEMEQVPLPPLLEGLSAPELKQFEETKDHTPFLPKNDEVKLPEGFHELDPAPFVGWKEVTAENPDPNFPEGFSDNPVYLAQTFKKEELKAELERAISPENDIPGDAKIELPTDSGEKFVANVPAEAVRDALQLQGEDTNIILQDVAQAQAAPNNPPEWKPTKEQIQKLRDGIDKYDWLTDGIMFAKEYKGINKSIVIHDDNGLAGEPPFATIDKDNNFEWISPEAHAKYGERLREIFDNQLDEINKSENKPSDNKPSDNPKDYSLKRTDGVDGSGTSLQGDHLTRRLDLEAAFGKPREMPEGGKVTTEWTVEFEDKNGNKRVVTIYDWKEDRAPSLGQDYRWHIGGDDPIAVELVKQELRKIPNPLVEGIRKAQQEKYAKQREIDNQKWPWIRQAIDAYNKQRLAEDFEVDKEEQIPDALGDAPQSPNLAPVNAEGAYRISVKTTDLQPGDITVGDHFVIEALGEPVPGTNRIALVGHYPGHVSQNTKQWNKDTEIQVIRGAQDPGAGELPVLSKPKSKDFVGKKEEMAAAQAEYNKQLAEASGRFVDPTLPSNQPHRAIVPAAEVKAGDITSDPVRGHFVIERTFTDENTKPGFVSIEGYYPGHVSQRKEWKVGTAIDVIRNVDAPVKGDLEALHQPAIVTNGKWRPDKDPAKREAYEKLIADAAARWKAPEGLPVIDAAKLDEKPENPADIPKPVGMDKPRRPYSPTMPAFQGDFAEMAREAGGDWAKFRELLAGKDIIFFDYETTGFLPEDGNEPWQLGAVKVRDGKIVDRFNVYMNPGRSIAGTHAGGNAVDDKGNPLTDEFLAKQLAQDAGHKQFLEWAGPQPLMAAQNMYFDDEVMRRMADKHGLNYEPAGLLDTLPMARDILKDDPNKPKNNLGALAEFFGVKLEGWHNADVDAEATANVFAALLAKAEKDKAGANLFDVDARQAEWAQSNERFNAQMDAYEGKMAQWAAIKAQADAANGADVNLEKVIADSKAVPVPNPDATPQGKVGDALQNVPAVEADPAILEFTANVDYPKGKMKMMDREWAMDDANTVLLPRDDIRMRDLLPGDFMSSKDGNIIWQVTAIRSGTEFGLDPGKVKVIRVNIDSGEISTYENYHGTRLDGVRRPKNPADLHAPDTQDENNKSAIINDPAPLQVDGAYFVNVDIPRGNALVKITPDGELFHMEGNIFDTNGDSVYTIDGTYRTREGAEAEAVALLQRHSQDLVEQARQVEQPVEAPQNMPISRGDIPAGADSAPHIIEVDNMPDGLFGNIEILSKQENDKPNYVAEASLVNQDGDVLADNVVENPDKKSAEKDARDFIASAADAHVAGQDMVEPKKKSAKPKKEKVLTEGDKAVLKNNEWVEENAGLLNPILPQDLKKGDFYYNMHHHRYEEVVEDPQFIGGFSGRMAMGRYKFQVLNLKNNQIEIRYFYADSPLRNWRRPGQQDETPIPEEPMRKGAGGNRGAILARPIGERIVPKEGRVLAGDWDKKGYFKDKNGELLKPGDVVIHQNPKLQAKYGKGVVKVRVGAQVEEGAKAKGLGRGGKMHADYVMIVWEKDKENAPREYKAGRPMVAGNLIKQGAKEADAPVAERAIAPEAPNPDMPEQIYNNKFQDKNGGDFEINLIKIGDVYEGALIDKNNPEDARVQIVVRKTSKLLAMDELADAREIIRGAANGREALQDIPNLDNEIPIEAPKEAVAPKFSGIDEAQIKENLADIKKQISDRASELAAKKDYDNRQKASTLNNAEVAINAFLDNFDINKKDSWDVEALDKAIRRIKRADEQLAPLADAMQGLRDALNDEKNKAAKEAAAQDVAEINIELGNKFEDLENREDIVSGFDFIANKLPKAKNYRAPENLRVARQAIDNINEFFNGGGQVDELPDYQMAQAIKRLRRESGNFQAQALADKLEGLKAKVEQERKNLVNKRLNAPLPELPSAKGINNEGLVKAIDELIQRMPDSDNADNEDDLGAAKAREKLKNILPKLKLGIDIEDLGVSDIESVVKSLKKLGNEKYKNFADILDSYVKDIQSRPNALGPKLPVNNIDAEKVSEQRVAGKLNEFSAGEKLQQLANDPAFLDNDPMLQPFAEELKKFFSDGQPKPLALLSAPARQALGKFVGKNLRNQNGILDNDPDKDKATLENLGNLAFQLREERLATAPNPTDLGVGNEILDMDFDELVKFANMLLSNNIPRARLKLKNQNTAFDIFPFQGDDKGVNITHKLIHRETGREFIIKRDTMVGVRGADAEIISAQLAQALGIAGSSYVARHNIDKSIVVTTFAGDGLNFEGEPEKIGMTEFQNNPKKGAEQGVMVDIIGLALLDAILINGDRHRSNLLVGRNENLPDVNTEKVEYAQFLPIDHGLAAVIVKGNSMAPEDYYSGASGDDSHRKAISIAASLIDSIGVDVYKQINDMSIQQAIQYMKRLYGSEIADKDLDGVIARLEAIRGIDNSKWKKILKKR
jgi:DNA polymerase III epsilon subunit-like protein